MMFDDLADQAFKLWGLHGTSLMVTLLLISFVCQTVGKAIPEDATGWRGTVRKVCKIVGIYVSNRVTAGISTADVAKAAIRQGIAPTEAEGPPAKPIDPAALAQHYKDESQPVLELREEDRHVVPAFPDFQRPRDSTGSFTTLEGDKP